MNQCIIVEVMHIYRYCTYYDVYCMLTVLYSTQLIHTVFPPLLTTVQLSLAWPPCFVTSGIISSTISGFSSA